MASNNLHGFATTGKCLVKLFTIGLYCIAIEEMIKLTLLVEPYYSLQFIRIIVYPFQLVSVFHLKSSLLSEANLCKPNPSISFLSDFIFRHEQPMKMFIPVSNPCLFTLTSVAAWTRSRLLRRVSVAKRYLLSDTIRMVHLLITISSLLFAVIAITVTWSSIWANNYWGAAFGSSYVPPGFPIVHVFWKLVFNSCYAQSLISLSSLCVLHLNPSLLSLAVPWRSNIRHTISSTSKS